LASSITISKTKDLYSTYLQVMYNLLLIDESKYIKTYIILIIIKSALNLALQLNLLVLPAGHGEFGA